MKIALQDMLSTVKDAALDVSKPGPLPEELQQTARRFVREAFAAVEAIAYVAKNSAAQLAEDSHIEMSPAEIAFAQDLEYSVDEKGVVRSSPAKIQMKRNVLFGIKLLSRFSKREFDPQVDWWTKLNSATALVRSCSTFACFWTRKNCPVAQLTRKNVEANTVIAS